LLILTLFVKSAIIYTNPIERRRTLSNENKVRVILRLCKRRGFVANVNNGNISGEEISLFGCHTSDEFITLIKDAIATMQIMVVIDEEVLAITCALSLDGGQDTATLDERRNELLASDIHIEIRTLARREKRGAEYLVQYIERSAVRLANSHSL